MASALTSVVNAITGAGASPSSQTGSARPISFLLTPEGGTTLRQDLLIRPADLQWTEPSRMSVRQTLGGAWSDSFGPGVATISISGNTGWRSTASTFDPGDGLNRFENLHNTVFKTYHEKVAELKSPEKVVLVFVDVLDGRAAEVVPQSFVLKRNKSSPLLVQYNISLVVIRDAAAPVPTPDAASVILKVLRLAAVAAATSAVVLKKMFGANSTAFKAAEIVYYVANGAAMIADPKISTVTKAVIVTAGLLLLKS